MKTPTVWPPPPDSSPPPEAENRAFGSPAQRRVLLISALGIGSIAGAGLLLPVTALLWSLAYASSIRPDLFVVAYLLLVCGVICSGPAAWILGNEASAGGTLTPDQIRQVRRGRTCGMVGLGFLGADVLLCILLSVW